MAEDQALLDRLMAIEGFIEEFLPPLIAASPARAQLEAQLRALADQETDPSEDAEKHWQATLAEVVLHRLPAG